MIFHDMIQLKFLIPSSKAKQSRNKSAQIMTILKICGRLSLRLEQKEFLKIQTNNLSEKALIFFANSIIYLFLRSQFTGWSGSSVGQNTCLSRTGSRVRVPSGPQKLQVSLEFFFVIHYVYILRSLSEVLWINPGSFLVDVSFSKKCLALYPSPKIT